MQNVLIVEDDVSIGLLLEEQLEADGYNVTGVARSLAEAVVSAKEHLPDFAIIDLYLAGGDLGTDVARRLREMTSVGIIFSTGNSDQNLMMFGGDAVMSKPYRISDVGRALKIIDEIARRGGTELLYPSKFHLIPTASP